ncbi:MAG TPA: HEAT repeat domain-containing protein [Thermoanaerobaculia bacterium]|nr:HEAT repeat domain-containing protein [Thermoanaerobaculia bacterium]
MNGNARPTTWHWRLLGRLGTDVRVEETRIATLLFAYSFLIGAFQFAAKSIRQSSFVDSLGWTQLPFVYLAVAIMAWPLLRAWNRLARGVPLARFIPRSTVAVIASMVLFWWLYGYVWPWPRFLFYVWISIVTLLVFSQFWSWASQLLDPRQARRLFAFVLSGALVGGVAGGQVATTVTRWIDARATLLAAAAILLATLPLIARIRTLSAGVGPDGRPRPSAAPTDDAAGSLLEIWRSPHLRSVAALMFLSIMVAEITDLQFNWVVEQATDRLDQRTMIFGNFFSAMALLSFVLQLLLTSRLQRSLGVGASMRVLPATMAVGTAGVLGAAALMPGALIHMVAALKIGEGALRYSLDQGTRELLYVPVPQEIRPRVKTTIDVLLQRVARAVAAVVLFTVSFGWVTPIGISWIVLALIVLWLGMTYRARRDYVAAFREGLLEHRIDPDERLDPSDATTLNALVASLGSSDSQEVLHAIDLLVAQGRAHLITPLLLHHDSPEVRRRTLEVLRSLELVSARPAVERLIADEDPSVRAEAIRTFAAFTGSDATKLLASKLRDADPRVRGAAIVGVLQLAQDEKASRAALGALDDLLTDSDPVVRQHGAQTLGGSPSEPPPPQPGMGQPPPPQPEMGQPLANRMLRLLSDPDPEVVRAAVRAVRRWNERDGTNFLFVPILISLLRERRLKHDVREALVSCGEEALPLLAHFLRDRDEHFWVRLALPKTIARFRPEPARDVLLGALPADETALEHAIIASLSSLRAREPGLRFPIETVEELVREQARRYLRAFARLDELVESGDFQPRGTRVVWLAERPPRLLEALLIDRLNDHVGNLFGLLSLVHRHREIWMAYERLKSDDGRTRNHALEFIDNTLRPGVRRQVMTVIDDLAPAERLAAAGAMFHIATGGGRVETLRGLIQGASGGDVAARWLGAAALAYIVDDGVRALVPLAEETATHATDPLLRETARWITERSLAPALGW